MFKNLFKAVTSFGATKMVFVVRTDLKMGSGKIASQCAHAAVILYDSSFKSNRMLLKSWMLSGQPKIVLRMDHNCGSRMKDLYNQAKKENLNVCLVHDAGRTQVDHGTLTVLGIGPNNVQDIDKLTSSLRLL